MVTLRERREALGFTQQEVADSAGTTQGNYGRIELGTTQIPRIEHTEFGWALVGAKLDVSYNMSREDSHL